MYGAGGRSICRGDGNATRRPLGGHTGWESEERMRVWSFCGSVVVIVLSACGGSTSGAPVDGGSKADAVSGAEAGSGGDAGRGPRADASAHDASSAAEAGSAAPLGAACIPDEEYDPSFQGFAVEDISTESKAFECASSLCLVNHFQGRVTCPYGQTAPGMGPKGPASSPAATEKSEDGCIVPGTSPSGSPATWQVTATNVSIAAFAAGEVPSQITGLGVGDRTANKTVYCSCRCANVDGKTDDGATYCACPDGFACTELITSIGTQDDTVSGAYCMLAGTGYSPATTDTANVCDATVTDPSAPGYCPVQR
jgi:hypothetical protein